MLVPDASVGAPPDQYSQQGQDWSQPPWNPQQLAEAGYGPWRDLLRTVLRHSGGIRVDHVLGLFRLFWLPRMDTPAHGAYMNYDFEAMVGVLVLEAQRAGAVVVGIPHVVAIPPAPRRVTVPTLAGLDPDRLATLFTQAGSAA